MRCWAVTGPVGAGKSSFSQALVKWGAVLVDADLLGHEVLRDPEVVKEIGLVFGSKVVEEGPVNRSRLGAIVFGDTAALEKLNAITHPRISALAHEKFAHLARGGQHTLVVFEAAVYFLLPDLPACDLVISVMATQSERIDRLMDSRGLTRAEAKARLKSQDSLEKHWETADIMVHNDGTLAELGNEAHKLLLEHRLIAGDDEPRRELSS